MRAKKEAPPDKPWPADKVERWSISKLRPYERNSRVHTPDQLKRIAKSIEQFGFTVPILVDDDGTILAGHARLDSAKMLKLSEVPVMVAKGWSEAQKRAYVVADNRLSEMSTWDNDMLLMELGDIADDIPLDTIGFSPQDMEKLLGEKLGPTEDDTGAGDAYKEQYAVMVLCKSEPDQERIYNELQAAGYDVKVVAT